MASTRLLKTFNDSFKSLSDLVITLLVPGTESACSAAAPAAPRASGNKVQHTDRIHTFQAQFRFIFNSVHKVYVHFYRLMMPQQLGQTLRQCTTKHKDNLSM